VQGKVGNRMVENSARRAGSQAAKNAKSGEHRAFMGGMGHVEARGGLRRRTSQVKLLLAGFPREKEPAARRMALGRSGEGQRCRSDVPALPLTEGLSCAG